MDARKAFDIVWHLGLMREMHTFDLNGNYWSFLKKWYENLISKIKWKGLLSKSIEERQGVRQGGIRSPTAYKIFINSLLQTFERNQLGVCIGPIYCGIPTVADDAVLISTDELQTMLNVQADHANKLRYLFRRIPIEGEIHKKILKTFGNIIRNDKSVEREIAFRQLPMKNEKSGSWFTKLHNLTETYGLP
ncbi:unnamed protein product [Mytilus coruscus]|uniref:Reverse transcriptase domain-containing protein n=1 Tax=Mytilus coruscus TaxID=42192 RepID=A0A6J8CAE2_MYTCO|nr:unnamed protein product [Mytilus coruscus]